MVTCDHMRHYDVVMPPLSGEWGCPSMFESYRTFFVELFVKDSTHVRRSYLAATIGINTTATADHMISCITEFNVSPVIM